VASDRGAERRLILLRHAKSSWPDSVPDTDRPLADRGIADATAAGPILEGIADPDVVLCSPALRTRQTWRLVSQALTDPPTPSFEAAIYGASAQELLELIRAVPADAGTVLVIGHEPTMSTTADLIAGSGSQAEDLAQLRRKYPTSGLAVFEVPSNWAELDAKNAVLEQFLIPRG
jgi:phosphohistidine phosphatase